MARSRGKTPLGLGLNLSCPGLLMPATLGWRIHSLQDCFADAKHVLRHGLISGAQVTFDPNKLASLVSKEKQRRSCDRRCYWFVVVVSEVPYFFSASCKSCIALRMF